MLIEPRLRRLEGCLAASHDWERAERIRAKLQRLTGSSELAALEEIADAQFEFGKDDPYTFAIIQRVTPILNAANEQYLATHGA